MKVCFITNGQGLGGAERVLLETIDVLREAGIECRVIMPGRGALANELHAMGIPVAFLKGGSWVSWEVPSLWARAKTIARVLSASLLAARKIRNWNCDIVYSNTLTVCHGFIVARLLRLPHIWHLHEFGREDHGVVYKFGEAFSNRIIGATSSECIVVSKALSLKYRRYVDASKLAVIYPSMHRAENRDESLDRKPDPTPTDSRRFRLVIVGGIVEGKGQADALEALATLVESGIDAELTLVGEAYFPYKLTLRKIVERKGLADRTFFVGNVRSAFPFMRTADVVLVCSRCEAFGRATVEGMLAGKAVVGAASGATPELVHDGFNGLLYKSGDPGDLAAKLRFLSEHPKLLNQLGENGRAWASAHFTRERYAGEVINVLSTLSSPSRSLATFY